MSEKTHAEIVKEMCCGPIPKHRHDREILRYYTHELNAAHRREIKEARTWAKGEAEESFRAPVPTAEKSSAVGDAAKLRKALTRIRDGIIGEDKLSPVHIVNIADAALAAPARNCDYHESLAAAKTAFDAIHLKHECEYGCPLGRTGMHRPTHECFEEWCFAAADNADAVCREDKGQTATDCNHLRKTLDEAAYRKALETIVTRIEDTLAQPMDGMFFAGCLSHIKNYAKETLEGIRE